MNKQVYPGLNFSEEEKRQEFDFDEIPGLREAGWTKAAYEQVLYVGFYLSNLFLLDKARRKLLSNNVWAFWKL